MASIIFENVDKSYDGINNVIENMSFQIEHGEFVVLIGSSGCGKTTILNMIAGLEDITKGNLYIDDKISNEEEPKDRNIAMIFQNYALYPHMTVYENIAFPLKNKNVDPKTINAKILDIASKLEISELLKRKPFQLSSGQKQRVAIGRAMIREPKIFLMDEPLSNLDTSLRNQLKQEIKILHNELGSTVIYVTHDQMEALTLATKIIIIKQGKIQQIGTPIELFTKPKNEYVAKFLGVPKINIIKNVKVDSLKRKKIINLFGQKIDITMLLRKEEDLTERNVNIGIRPEDFKIENPEEYVFNVNTDYVELIGSEYIVHGTTNYNNKKERLVFKIPLSKFKNIPDNLKISPIINMLHIFDATTKERINYE